jgi:F-type H+-transporting ATPase subunit c
MFSTNKRVLATIVGILGVGLAPGSAFAQVGGAASNSFDMQAAATLGAALAMGLAVLGGALGQGRTAAAALEGISRNPGAASRIQIPMILGLALIESLVLVAFALAYILQSKAPG